MYENLTRLRHLRSALLQTADQIAGVAGAAADAIEEVAASAVTVSQLDSAVQAALAGNVDPAEVYKNTRPADWLPVPEPNDNEIYLLVHIPDGVSSLLAFTVTCTGSYQVKIKDTAAAPSGSKFETELSAADFGSLTASGMKQVLVKISGTDILSWEPSEHSKKPDGFASWNIVEIKCRLPVCTSVKAGNRAEDAALNKLRFYTQRGPSAFTDLSNMFMNCSALAAVPELDTAGAANMSGMFRGCSSLAAVPQMDTARAADMSYLFSGCSSLTKIPLLDTGNVTNMSGMFMDCYALTEIPALNTPHVTDMSYMCSNCTSLTAAPLLDTGSVTNMKCMFESCSSLRFVPLFDTGNVSSMENMFINCGSLREIPCFNTARVTDMPSMFDNCRSLSTIPAFNTAQVTDMSYLFNACCNLTAVRNLDISHIAYMGGIFTGCPALQSVTFAPSSAAWAGYNISFKDCSLGHTALVNLFNSLPVISKAKTLTLTGNPGVSELTDAEKTVAANKNWTLKL